ncbi:hypothetical protein NA78x_001124 [Anatilimnocola sp. NA78]|uniref:hypothetical protein n=1 Tax=Anatilimnocola sp. NA78 TaxID=3415683 RepID=UPI003CE515E6
MTTHETVNRRYSDLQMLLHKVFNAEGRGLGEMVRSVESQLSPTLCWEIRAIAHIRNKVVHEGLAVIPRYFEPLCKEALGALKRLKAERKVASKPKRQLPAKTAKTRATLPLKVSRPKTVKAKATPLPKKTMPKRQKRA